MTDTISDELRTIDLGDKRLNDRARELVESLAANPEASINSALNGWDETLAGYRFFDNSAVEPEAILSAHVDATHRRIESQDVVLVVQDTTELDFTAHPTKDAGSLNTPKRRGFYDQTHLALTPEKLCLGVLQADFFDRDPQTLGKAKDYDAIPIEQKESYRWLAGYRLACQLAEKFDDKQIISVADREGDIYEIFVEQHQRETPADFLVRAQADRSLTEKDAEAGPYSYKKVRREAARSECRIVRQLELPATPKRKARTASVEVRAIPVTVKPPLSRGELPTVQYNVVLVEEVGGPGDGTDIQWLLITTLPIDTTRSVLRVIELYAARWAIEVYFRVYKTGCRVEEIQLETNDRLRRCLMLYKIIGWRVMYLTFLGRACPELSCEVVFAKAEWKSVYKIVNKKTPPKKPPRLGDFLPLVAQLGGYNRRANDPPPGPQAIWVGLRRTVDFGLAWDAFGPDT